MVFAEEVRGLQEQLRQIKTLLQSSWCFGNGPLRLLGLDTGQAPKRHQKYNPAKLPVQFLPGQLNGCSVGRAKLPKTPPSRPSVISSIQTGGPESKTEVGMFRSRIGWKIKGLDDTLLQYLGGVE